MWTALRTEIGPSVLLKALPERLVLPGQGTSGHRLRRVWERVHPRETSRTFPCSVLLRKMQRPELPTYTPPYGQGKGEATTAAQRVHAAGDSTARWLALPPLWQEGHSEDLVYGPSGAHRRRRPAHKSQRLARPLPVQLEAPTSWCCAASSLGLGGRGQSKVPGRAVGSSEPNVSPRRVPTFGNRGLRPSWMVGG